MKTDSQIQKDVMQELTWNPSVAHERIGVAVQDGIVTLSGATPSFMEKVAAEEAAQRVAGVRAVVEKIEVKLIDSYKRDDQDIAKALLNHFKWNIQVPEAMVKASVENGWVKLAGEVEWDFQRAAAEKCARALTGVKGVSNNITLKVKDVQPEKIKQEIKEALTRKTEREVNHIGVEVRRGKVTLSGTVDSYADMQDARGAVFGVAGVMSLENNLHVSN